jgi:hypothetical protein
MLRPFSARQLHLVAGDGKVAAFAVLGDRWRGSAVDVHVPTLRRRMRDLSSDIDTVVFFDEPVPDGALVGLIDDMVEAFDLGDTDVLAYAVPVTEAVKWVEEEMVVRAIDRSVLVSIRCPEVVRRAPLEDALDDLGDAIWANPTELVVADGGTLSLFEPRIRESST